MPKLHVCDPYTEQWWKLRLGIPTASQFHRIVTPTGRPSAQAWPYMCKLITERVLGESMDEQFNRARGEWVEHGHIYEAAAIDQFQKKHALILQRVGFVTDDRGTMGSSPDCIVSGSLVAVEVKCPAPWTHMRYLLGGPEDDYTPQVQGHLLVGEWDKVHFVSFHPRMPLVDIEVGRDEKFIKILKKALDLFCDRLDEETERARELGDYLTDVVKVAREPMQ